MTQEDEHVLLCFWCRKRIAPEELLSARHDHIDVEEHLAYDIAVNNSDD